MSSDSEFSQTNPLPAGFLERHWNAIDAPSFPTIMLQSQVLPGEDSRPNSRGAAPSPSPSPLSQETLDLPDDTRLIIAPAPGQVLQSLMPQKVEDVIVQHSEFGKDIYTAQQTLRTPTFDLFFGECRVQITYHPGSDDIIILNRYTLCLELRQIFDDESNTKNGNRGGDKPARRSTNEVLMLEPFAYVAISPGSWLMSHSSGAEVAELTLLPRQFVLEKRTAIASATGTKRKADSDTEDGRYKRRHADEGHGIIVFQPSTTTSRRQPLDLESSMSSMTLVERGNPFDDMEPGDTVTIRTTGRTGSSQPSTPSSQTPRPNYSLRSLRTIAGGRALTRVFRGVHSLHGDVVVKLIRSSTGGELETRARLARDWVNEERILRTLDHVRPSKPLEPR